tara:strand:- start:3596 stop:4042 length:447 start_codon:yes stop_codon:yes gene_type:complete
MAEHSRYKVTAKQAGVEKYVLKNKLDITDQKSLDDTETILLQDTYTYFIEILEKGEIKFNLSLFFDTHKYFLFTLYSWAGKIREVDISKDGVHFASCRYIDSSIKEFEKIFSFKRINPQFILIKNLDLIRCFFYTLPNLTHFFSNSRI